MARADCDALLLSAGELAGNVVGAVFEGPAELKEVSPFPAACFFFFRAGGRELVELKGHAPRFLRGETEFRLKGMKKTNPMR